MKTLVLIAALLAAPSFARAQDSTAAAPETLRRVVQLPVFDVSTARAGEHAPVAKTVLSRGEAQALNWGQDTPMALATLPGAYAYSDAGNGIGYSYLTIRGFPQRRISVLINGVPLNDPESHEVYWIDHPDLLASTSEVQLQRGVGSALYGAASLGGSVDVETGPMPQDRFARAAWSYGTFDTRRLVVEMGSGRILDSPLDEHHAWNFYGRYSRITTLGYRDQSWTRLWSYALSAQRLTGRHLFKLNLYGGPETTHLAYLGVARDILDGALTGDADRDRRFNPITYPGEADHFFEPHYELVHSWAIRPDLVASQTLFYFDGEGYYDEQRFLEPLASYRLAPWTTTDPALFGADSLAYYANDGVSLTRDAQGRVTVQNFDVVRRRWIGNRHFGWIPRMRIGGAANALTMGGELRWHDGHHVGTVISGNGLPPGTDADHPYYDFHPRTFSAGLFARKEWQPAGKWFVTADAAWRHQDYFMRDDRFDGVRFDQGYDFALPRLGVQWRPAAQWTLSASAAHSRREPAFRDLYDAEGVGGVPLLSVGARLRPERVNDYELGAEWSGNPQALAGVVRAKVGLFRMDFRDELVYAGQFNTDLGYPVLGNAARSVHQGAEAEAGATWHRGLTALTVSANATLSDNHFMRYREVYGTSPGDTIRYDGKALGFFPAVMTNLNVRMARKGAAIGASLQQVGRQYLDQTESREGSVAPHAVLNVEGSYAVRPLGRRISDPRLALTVRVFNALNRRYETSGYSYLDAGTRFTDFIPAATRSVLGELRLEF